MLGYFNYNWSEIWLLLETKRTWLAVQSYDLQQTNKIFSSPMKGTGILEGQLVHRNLKISTWKKKLWNGLTNLKF